MIYDVLLSVHDDRSGKSTELGEEDTNPFY